MSYQIKHVELGLFQGDLMGMGFWSLLSDLTELGIVEFYTYEEAEDYVAFLCSGDCSEPLMRTDLTIEMYDTELNQEMKEVGYALT